MKGKSTPLGRVRGLGSAQGGTHHWWHQRVTAFGNVILITWLIVALVSLPGLEYGLVRDWLHSPFVAVPMALMVVNVFYHFRLGLQVVIEDYSDADTRVMLMALLHVWTFGMGAMALFAILKIALGAATGATGVPV